jgi:hypothetical protein
MIQRFLDRLGDLAPVQTHQGDSGNGQRQSQQSIRIEHGSLQHECTAALG